METTTAQMDVDWLDALSGSIPDFQDHQNGESTHDLASGMEALEPESGTTAANQAVLLPAAALHGHILMDAEASHGIIAPEVIMQQQGLESQSIPSQHFFPEVDEFAMDEFFRLNGAWRPVDPCTHCRRLRLQCFSLQTTSDNPNPVTACSSCVALFRHCSLAGPEKRQASAFETPLPVIGQLHGVYEDVDTSIAETSDLSMKAPELNLDLLGANSKRSSSRARHQTRPLRLWLAANSDNPYPTDDEKTTLVQTTGLTMTQVVNWFTNARRRRRLASGSARSASRKVFRDGSPMPSNRAFAGESPMERWRNSPPEQDAVSVAAIEHAAAHSVPEEEGWTPEHSLHHRSSSAASVSSSSWADSDISSAASFSDSHGSQSGISRALKHKRNSRQQSKRASRTGSKDYVLSCTFCQRTFAKRSDWVRHEQSIHLPDLDVWMCSDLLSCADQAVLWRVGRSVQECAYCGHESPDEYHVQLHDFVSCGERTLSERAFYRKDHLWQHLSKFHRCEKWEGWELDSNVNALRQKSDAVDSVCGFCAAHLTSWRERIDHLAGHFQEGLSRSDWQGGHGVGEPWCFLVQNVN